MTSRTRRWLISTAVVVVLLFVGRWTSEFLVERWWAATISPAALSAVTRWSLLGLALDILAIGFASLWFMLQALAISRTIGAVHIARRIGNLELREHVPTRHLYIGAAGLGILLGWISGAGAHVWRAPVALAWQGVHWGVADPLLKADLGLFVARLPVWELALDYLLTLTLLGLIFSATLYFVIGAARRKERAFDVHPLARRHLGWLLGLLALSIAINFFLSPWQLAASAEVANSLEAARPHLLLDRLPAFVALITMAGCVTWGSGRSTGARLMAGWALLAFAAVVTPLIAPARPHDPADQERALRFNQLAWGIASKPGNPARDSTVPVTAVWDERLLDMAEASVGRHFLAATPVTAADGTAAWLVASSDSTRQDVRVRTIAEGIIAADGGAVPVAAMERLVTLARSRPGAPEWERVTQGVTVGNLFTKLIVAWGRQAGAVPSVAGRAELDWHLDPGERASAVLPMAIWLAPDVTVLDGRPTWVMQGLIPVSEFPLATRQRILGEDFAGLLPGFVAVVDIESGAMRFYLDPAASPPARSWVGFAPGLIAPADSMPRALRTALPYAGEWLALQMTALAASGVITTGAPFAPSVGAPAIWEHSGPARQQLIGGGALVTAARRAGVPEWHVDSSAAGAGSGRDELQQAFQQFPALARLRDSIRAGGDTSITGALRWWHTGSGTLAWCPLVALTRSGGPRVIAVATARQGAPAMVRRPELAWATGGASAVTQRENERSQLDEARLWMLRADSALRRGDLTAFGRYFEGLQRALGKGPP